MRPGGDSRATRTSRARAAARGSRVRKLRVSYVRTRAGFPGSPSYRPLGPLEHAGAQGGARGSAWGCAAARRPAADEHPRQDSRSGASNCTPSPELRTPSTLRLQNPWGPQVLEHAVQDLQHPRRESCDPLLAAPGTARVLGSGLLGPAPCPSQALGPPPKAVQAHLGCTGQGPGRDLAGPGRAASSLSAALSL